MEGPKWRNGEPTHASKSYKNISFLLFLFMEKCRLGQPCKLVFFVHYCARRKLYQNWIKASFCKKIVGLDCDCNLYEILAFCAFYEE